MAPSGDSSTSDSSDEPTDPERLASSLSASQIASLVTSHVPGFGPPSVAVVDPDAVCGGYNAVWFVSRRVGDEGGEEAEEEKVVVRVPAPESFDALSFEADVEVMKLIGKETTIPIPQVLAYKTSGDEAFPHPFAILTYLPGTPLSELWYASMSEQQQSTVLRRLASIMLQLGKFTHPRLGDLVFDRDAGQLTVGPFRDRDVPQFGDGVLEPEETFPFVASGPFTTAAEMHTAILCRLRAKQAHDVPFWWIATRVLEPMHLNAGPFVLGHPDFDVQNVLVDPETFEVTGLIDWDSVSRVLPPPVGFARYPGWITRDWNPLRYGWQDPDVPVDNPEAQLPLLHREESPTELANHRKTFFSAVREIDPQLARDVTEHSHVHKALMIALGSPLCRGEISSKLLDFMFDGAPDDLNSAYVLHATERSDWWTGMGSRGR